MRPLSQPSSPRFQILEPTIFDSDMENAFERDHFGCLDPAVLDSSTPDASSQLEDLFLSPRSATQASESTSCLSPAKLTLNGTSRDSTSVAEPPSYPSDTQTDSPADSSHASSADSPVGHIRNPSIHSSRSEAFSPGSVGKERFLPSGWSHTADFSATQDTFFGQDNESTFLKDDFTVDGDLEMSNKAMDSAFDFDSAASSPSPSKIESKPESQGKPPTPKPSNVTEAQEKTNRRQPLNNHTPSPFVFQGSHMPSSSYSTTQGQSHSGYWHAFSPPSVEQQERSAAVTTVDSQSPLHTTLSPSLDLGLQAQAFDHMHFAGAQFTMGGHIAPMLHPARTFVSRPRPILVVHPTSLKSRVETQIPIKLTLYPLPYGVKKLRLPSHTISKPKFLAKPEVERSPEILELCASVVCTSAMQDKVKLERALRRARGERTNGEGSDGLQKEPETPLEGAEVKICSGCIQRERKRASRKKQRKPEEDELFQRDEDKRIVVFNTTQIKDWVEAPKSANPEPGTPPLPVGAMQVELPMRIACYCRHQNEKQGFQVIFTVKNYLGDVLAQAITNSIMITDDHKTHSSANVAAAAANSGTTENKHPSGASASSKADAYVNQPPFKLSHSATDLQALRNQYPMSPNSLVSGRNGAPTATVSSAPRSLSRQASPNDIPAPSAKRRKQSGTGKVPANLSMTKMDSSRPSPSSTNSSSVFNSPLTVNGRSSNVQQPDLPFVMPSSISTTFVNGPPTPGNNDMVFFGGLDRPSMSENPSQSGLMSAPNSAQPSRPGTPGGTRSSFQEQNVATSTATTVASQAWSIPPAMPRLPTMIHKLVPSEGSTTGGNEVTILGSGFVPGMEVVFGDTLATTTTFWGDKCLNCLTPPALQPGTVPVVFKHEHPRFGQPQAPPIVPKQQVLYRYVDDRELQMYRVALSILGQKLRNPADAFQTAQQIMGSDPNTLWNFSNFQNSGSGQNQHGNGNGNYQNNNINDLDAKMLIYLEFMDLDDSPRSPRFSLRSPSGQTLLHYAASLGLTRFVAGLLARGADPNVADNNGNTPMHLAALSGHSHIIHRLRLSGANAKAESVRGFTPADLATTLPAHQAVLVPSHHYRSRSVDSTRSLRRRPSTASLDVSWESSSSEDVLDSTPSSDEGDDETEQLAPSRRTSVDQGGQSALYSREASVPPTRTPTQPSETEQPETEVERSFSPPAALLAWRDQLAAQINQFQQSVNRAFPNLPALPALPPMPTLPDYQAHPMMRRITALVPQRPTTAWSTSIMKDGWDRLTGNSSPPPYEELYPNKNESEEDQEVKKASIIQAAADAALDQHFETMSSEPAASSSESAKDEIGDLRIGRKNISRQQQEQLRKAHARKMKRIRSDHNLFFIWIPLLLLITVAMLRNFVPDVWHGVSQGYQFLKDRYLTQGEGTNTLA
ncbi:hypothetical protein VTO42DRAFT_8419 [Malbranchea cinnamomea]